MYIKRMSNQCIEKDTKNAKSWKTGVRKNSKTLTLPVSLKITSSTKNIPQEQPEIRGYRY